MMELRSLAALLILALAAGLTGCQTKSEAPASRPASAVKGPASVPVAKQSNGGCLDCHGPFDTLILTSTNYVAPSGEKTSPHRYVPHDSKLAKDVPDCSHCHTAHSLDSLPAKGSVDLSKVSVQWCYATCHHEKNFKSCKDCHP